MVTECVQCTQHEIIMYNVMYTVVTLMPTIYNLYYVVCTCMDNATIVCNFCT